MSEIRKNPVTNGWIIISTERAKRPRDYHAEEIPDKVDVPCPFCPRKEDLTPGEICSYRAPEDNGKWWLRGFPAQAPILKIEGEIDQKGFGIYDHLNGIGAHEIIVETPDHHERYATMNTNQIEKILWAYRDRIIDLKRDKRFRYILVFKNHGKRAGASDITHLHSQIIALPVTPKKIKEELENARFHYNLKERCIFCDIIDQELQLEDRVIMKTAHFIALAPWAPRFPFETWILPLKHSHDFTQISKEQIMDLSYLIRSLFRGLSDILGADFSFNQILHDTPNLIMQEGYWDTIEKDFHWHFEIIPRLTNIAGFEWGTGFYINHLPPEYAAKELRKVIYK